MVKENDKLGELIAEIFKEDDGSIGEVSAWYRDLDASDIDVPKVERLPDGKVVCPGSPKTCLWAGWCPDFERICDSCPYQPQCFPSSGGLPLTEPVILKDIRPMKFFEDSENS